jgi:hypothetical protein
MLSIPRSYLSVSLAFHKTKRACFSPLEGSNGEKQARHGLIHDSC